MRHETPAGIRIQKARTTLLLDHPFFGSLLFRLKGRENRSIPTMATDGVSLYYNPEFVDTLNSATLAGVLAHEVMHPALQHHVRRSGRDPRRWNEACDYAINPLLLDAGLSLPDGVLVDHRFRGMSAEQIYNLREGEAQPQSGGQDRQATVPELARAKRQKSKATRIAIAPVTRRRHRPGSRCATSGRRDAEC
jgi:predicted metal-dependent peptidase